MKKIKFSLYLCVILTQIFLFNTPVMANNIIPASNEEIVPQYFLIYDANGGDNAPALQQNTSNIFYISYETPNLADNTFVGWATTPNAIQAEYQPGEIFFSNTPLTILYAVWQSNQALPVQTFTLLYDANGGEQAPTTQTKQTTEIFCQFTISSDEPVRAGYIFLGWSTSPEALSAEFLSGDEFWAINSQTTLYAIWQEDNPQPLEHCYILIYDANGGSTAPEPQIEYDFDFFHVFTITEAKPVRPGWNFLGWHTDADALVAKFQPNEVFLALNEQNILYAIWQEQEQPPEPEAIEYKLYYNVNGGFNTPAEQHASGTETNCLFTISEIIPQRINYKFLGWALEANATQAICQPGGSLITTEKQTILYAVWQKLPDEPTYSYLKELLGSEAVKLECANTAAGHLTFSYALKENSYSFHINQTNSNNFTATLNIKPSAYLNDYNTRIDGHKLIATYSPAKELLTLFYDEENKAWITTPNYNSTFIINCHAPARPTYAELAQILGTSTPIQLECINASQTEHYPIGLNLEQNGLQIGPTLPYSNSGYCCLLTFQAQPYIERYNTTYGPHKLVLGAENEQTVQLYYKSSTQNWQTNNSHLPCFKLICTEPAPPLPLYQYKLYFNGNGGVSAPYPQTATAQTENYTFFIPKEQPTRHNYKFIGWAPQANANYAVYQPEDQILLYKETPELTLYAVWQLNDNLKPEPGTPQPPLQEPLETAYCLYYHSNGGFDTPAEQICYSTAEKYQFEITAEKPKRNGYTFIGWALTPTNSETIYQAGNQIILSQNQPSITLYAVWQEGYPENYPDNRPSSSSSGSIQKQPTQSQPEEAIQTSNNQQLLHFDYINGYGDGTIRPNAYLSRAEAAVMLYRLLNPNASETVTSAETNWYDTAVDFLKQNSLLQGYQDGSIKPNSYLTRAELATLAIRIYNLQTSDEPSPVGRSISKTFPDIAEHWAANVINQATDLGLLHGYPDGSFRPNQPISRAEAVTLLNLLFNRTSCTEHLINEQELPNWSDNLPDSWYYSNMLEAGCSHTYTIAADTNIILSIID